MADTSKMWVEEPLISVIHFLILVIFIKESEFIAGLKYGHKCWFRVGYNTAQ